MVIESACLSLIPQLIFPQSMVTIECGVADTTRIPLKHAWFPVLVLSILT